MPNSRFTFLFTFFTSNLICTFRNLNFFYLQVVLVEFERYTVEIWDFLSLVGVQNPIFFQKGKKALFQANLKAFLILFLWLFICSNFLYIIVWYWGKIERKNVCGIWCNFAASSASLWHPLFLLSFYEGKVKTACEEIQETHCRHFST